MRVNFRSTIYLIGIGETIPCKIWVERKQRAKYKEDDIEFLFLNERIDEWEEAANKAIAYFKDYEGAPDKTEFERVVHGFRFEKTKKKAQRISFLEYIDTFIERYEGVRSVSRIKHFKLCKSLMKRYQEFIGETIFFEDLDINFYNGYKKWFYSNGYSANYFGEQVKILRQIVNEAREIDNVHQSQSIKAKGITAPKAEVESVYLTEDELIRIHRLEINEDDIAENHPQSTPEFVSQHTQELRKAKDMFLIGAFTGLRFSDFSRLRESNVGEFINITSEKTDTKSVIPIHWVVREIFDRGYDFGNPLYEQRLNKLIKEVVKMAGITENVMLMKSIGGKMTEVVGPKNTFVSTHTARRSFATNAYKAGVPTIAIMKITGHKRESTFMRYIQIKEEENAEMLQKHSFFSGNRD